MPRFVILEHNGLRKLHWDFMLQWNDALRTWALAEAPEENIAIAAEPLPDHRIAYLDYEGPVSGGRGEVTQWDDGLYALLDENGMVLGDHDAALADRDRPLHIRLSGRRLRGLATLTRDKTPAPIARISDGDPPAAPTPNAAVFWTLRYQPQ